MPKNKKSYAVYRLDQTRVKIKGGFSTEREGYDYIRNEGLLIWTHVVMEDRPDAE